MIYSEFIFQEVRDFLVGVSTKNISLTESQDNGEKILKINLLFIVWNAISWLQKCLAARQILWSTWDVTNNSEREYKKIIFHHIVISNQSFFFAAIVDLAIGRQLEDAVQKYNGNMLKDNAIEVKTGFSGRMLGIAHIPLTYTDKAFKELCEQHGPVEYAYIMRSKKGGKLFYFLVVFKNMSYFMKNF